MLETIFYCILLLLTLFGVIFCVRELLMLLLVPPKSSDISIIIPFSGNADDMEYTVMCVVKRNRWFDRFKNARIILLDNGMNEQAIKTAEILCGRYGELTIADGKNLEQAVKGIKNDT